MEPPRDTKWRTMTVASCIRIVEAFQFRGGVSMWRPALVAYPSGSFAVKLHFSLLVPNRNVDEPLKMLEIAADTMLSLEEINRDMYPFEDRIADFIRGVLEHELDEGVFVGERQHRDPHRKAG